MSRFCAILFWIMIGASVTQAEWPIPTADGTTWRYAFTREGETEPGTLTRQVFAPKNPEEQNILRIETAINGTTYSTEFLKNESNAILATAYRVQGGKTEAFDPAITILPADLKLGTEWNYHGPIAGLDLNLPLKIVGEGDIDVPAGKFRALHFRGEKNEGCAYCGRLLVCPRSRLDQGNGDAALAQRRSSHPEHDRASLNFPRDSRPNRSRKKRNWKLPFPPAATAIHSTSFPTTRCKSWRAGVVMACEKMPGSAPFGLHKIPGSRQLTSKWTKQPLLRP